MSDAMRADLPDWIRTLAASRRHGELAQDAGAELDGLYPLGERWRSAYEAWLREQAR